MGRILGLITLFCFVSTINSFANVGSSKNLKGAFNFQLNDALGPGPDALYKTFLDQLYVNTAKVEEQLINIDFNTVGRDIDTSLSKVIDIFNAINLDGNSKARILDILSVNHHSTGSSFSELKAAGWHLLELAAANPMTLPAFTVLYALFLVFGGIGYDDDKVGSPYDAGTKTYSVETAERFYSGKPLFVLRRLLKLASITGAFNLKVFIDWRTGNIEKNQKERAKEALVLATQLGECNRPHIPVLTQTTSIFSTQCFSTS